MKASIESEKWFKQILEQDTQFGDNTPDWLMEYRNQAKQLAHDSFDRGLLPKRKQEAWRYTSLSKLQENSFYLNFDASESEKDLRLKNEWLGGFDSYRAVFVEGRFSSQLSELDGLPSDCYVGSLAQAMTKYSELISKWVGQSNANQSSIFSQLNNAMLKDGLFVYLPKGKQLKRPIEVIYLSGGEEKLLLSQPHNLIMIENAAQATLTERFISLNTLVHFNNYVTEVFLAPQAILNHVQVQQQNFQSYYLNHVGLALESESDYCGTFLALGGAMARTELSVDFKQAGAKCSLNGLYTISEEQVIDFHLDIRHGVPGCESETHFKGVVLAKGRAVFDGSIVIEKDAQKSQAHLSNKNLLLTRKAEVDSKPQLEIYADDVKCSHGTTIGQLEEEQVFYLCSRGLSEHNARKLLAMGFAKDSLNQIKITELSHTLETLIEGVLETGVKQ